MTATLAPPQTAAARVARPGLVLLLACVAQFMLLVDDTITNVALPTIAADLGFSESSLSWVVNAYLLTFGGFLLIGGRLADRFGPRRHVHARARRLRARFRRLRPRDQTTAC